MISSFDYYKRVESPVMYLCNPDKKFICTLQSENRHLILRFNDLSELTFSVPKALCGESAYALIESKRLIFIEKIGWFQIENVTETVEGDACTKAVTAQSHQYCLKNRGFVAEERLYMFYNPYDPLDERYDGSNLAAIPSVIGQLYQQTGIKVELSPYSIDVTEDKIDWTITYIDPILKFQAKSYGAMYEPADGAENVCRSFKADKKLNGYDFIINQVEKAFEVIFEFDFLYHTIQVKTLEDITAPTDIYLSFDNLVNTLEVQENAEDIVTVLSCSGGDIDIRTVNPMGTNYIVDFSYYKKAKSDDGKVDYPWMSAELIHALDEWKAEFDKNKDGYSTLVEKLQNEYVSQVENSREIQSANLKLTDLQAARDQYTNKEEGAEDGSGIVSPETVEVGEKSLKSGTKFYTTPFSAEATLTGHTGKPEVKKAETTGIYTFSFSDSGKNGTANSLLQDYLAPEEGDKESEETGYLYFMDDDTHSYCKLNVKTIVEVAEDVNGNPVIFLSTQEETGYVNIDDVRMAVTKRPGEEYTISYGATPLKFASKAYFVYSGNRYMVSASADGIVTVTRYYAAGFDRFTTYKETAGVGGWCDIWEAYIKDTLVPEKNDIDGRIEEIESQMKAISDVCNVQKFVKSKGGSLYDELSNYWIEGECTNDNIAASDSTTISERIELAKELMEAGEADLEKNAQPKFEMSVNAVNFIKIYEFRQFTRELELGRVITIEKADGVHYYPALMSIEYDIDSADSFTLTFSNASKPGDTAMTFADLIKEASSTSRTVSANWSNLMDYTHNKDQITRLIEYPLDRSLRAMQENLSNQEFIIDDSGILGRKYDTEFDGAKGTFSPEQVRMINNTIIFTKDNWETAALALGKTVYGYGLVAEVLVGNIILGEQISIGSKSERVTISDDGIVIKDNNGQPIFNASKDGNLSLKGNITATGLEIDSDIAKGAGIATSGDIDIVKGSIDGVKTDIENLGTTLRQEFKVADGELKSTIEETVKTTYATIESVSELEQTANGISVTVSEIQKDYATKQEVEDGYATKDNLTQATNEIKDNYATKQSVSDLTVKANEISAEVSTIQDTYAPQEGASESFSYILKSNGFMLNANGQPVFECDKDGVEVTGKITALSGKIAGLTITDDALEGVVGDNRLALSSSQLYIGNDTKYMTFGSDAKLTVVGGNIEALSGSIICNDLQTNTLKISDGRIGLTNSSAGGYIDLNYDFGNSSSTVTMTATLTRTNISPGGGESYKRDRYTVTVDKILLQSVDFEINVFESRRQNTEVMTRRFTINIPAGKKQGTFEYQTVASYYDHGFSFAATGSATYKFTQKNNASGKNIAVYGSICPASSSGTFNIGSDSYRWNTVYAKTSEIDSSDANEKKDIMRLPEVYEAVFDALEPVVYKFRESDSGRTHSGLIAQQVKEVLIRYGIDTKDFAAYCEWENADGQVGCGLRYAEFIPICIAEIQRLKKRISEIEKA